MAGAVGTSGMELSGHMSLPNLIAYAARAPRPGHAGVPAVPGRPVNAARAATTRLRPPRRSPPPEPNSSGATWTTPPLWRRRYAAPTASSASNPLTRTSSPRARTSNGSLNVPWHDDLVMQLIAIDDIGTFAALAFADPGLYLGRPPHPAHPDPARDPLGTRPGSGQGLHLG